MKKQSNRGRPRSARYVLAFTIQGRESFISLRPEEAAALAGVSVKTVYHWINGTKTPSPQVQQLLEIKAGGVLPWRAWCDWRVDFATGRMLAPNGYSFQPGELAWWSLEKALRAELQRENAALRVQVETLRAQLQEQAANHSQTLVPFARRKKAGR